MGIKIQGYVFRLICVMLVWYNHFNSIEFVEVIFNE